MEGYPLGDESDGEAITQGFLSESRRPSDQVILTEGYVVGSGVQKSRPCGGAGGGDGGSCRLQLRHSRVRVSYSGGARAPPLAEAMRVNY